MCMYQKHMTALDVIAITVIKQTYTHTQRHTRTHTHKDTDTDTHTRTLSRIQGHTHIHVRTHMYICVYTSIPEAHEAVGHHGSNNSDSNVGPLHHQPHVSEIAEEGDHCVGMDGRQPCERRVCLLLVPKAHCLGLVRVSYSERERGGVRERAGTRARE